MKTIDITCHACGTPIELTKTLAATILNLKMMRQAALINLPATEDNDE